MNVHRRFRIPSERFKSFTKRMTRKSLKKVADTLMFSDDYLAIDRGGSGHYIVSVTSAFLQREIQKEKYKQSNLLRWPALGQLPAEKKG